MLEAIHLLLAVPLFVTVVAVDPRWLLRAIAAHYRDILENPQAAGPTLNVAAADPDDQELWHSSPAQYLEKIFQVVLTLPPLESGGYQRLLRTLVAIRQPRPARSRRRRRCRRGLPPAASPAARALMSDRMRVARKKLSVFNCPPDELSSGSTR